MSTRIKSLIVNGKTIKVELQESILSGLGFQWLLDSEFENAILEIKKDTLIWNGGTYYHGDWYFGIWNDGTFWGNFHSGIWNGGTFKGKKINGIFNNE